MELERFGDEVRYREAVVDRRPEEAEPWRDLGRARRRAGAAREAVTCFREALRLDPQDAAGAGIELGRALRELGEPERRPRLTGRPRRASPSARTSGAISRSSIPRWASLPSPTRPCGRPFA